MGEHKTEKRDTNFHALRGNLQKDPSVQGTEMVHMLDYMATELHTAAAIKAKFDPRTKQVW